MAVTLAEAKAAARARMAAREHGAALAAFDHLLRAQPLDDELRLEIATLLGKAGKTAEAGEILRALSLHLMRAGRPLPALVAAAGLPPLGQPSDFLLAALADMYGADSPKLGPFAARPAPIDQAATVPELPEGAGAEPLDALIAPALARALDFAQHPPYQEQVHPIAFLSELGAEPLRAVLASLAVRTVAPGAAIVRQGEPGTALYLVASGQLRVETTGGDEGPRELARLHENSLFGEMALVTSQPRGASVVATELASVLELERGALDRVRAEIPSIEAALARFTRERLIRNLLATSPLFTPFSREQQSQLLQRFEGTEVAPGTTVIREGEPGRGIFVVLAGTLDVHAHPPGEAPVALGTLRPGDLFGEMSLLTEQPTSATVTATAGATLLFLSRVYVERLIEAVPEVKDYFARLAESRAAHNSVRLPGALPEIPVDLDDSEGILL